MSGGDKLLDVEVDPQDVVAVPTDYNGTKMRVSKFKVVSESKGIIKKALVESSYEIEEDFESSDNCPSCGAGDQYGNFCSECGEQIW
jgi:methionyl-tRNA synthetase